MVKDYVVYKGLKFYFVDDDFIEHLHEMGFETIELDELFVEWSDWSKENCEC